MSTPNSNLQTVSFPVDCGASEEAFSPVPVIFLSAVAFGREEAFALCQNI